MNRIKQVMRKPLSEADLRTILGDCKILTYPQLAKYNTLEELSPPHTGQQVANYAKKRKIKKGKFKKIMLRLTIVQFRVLFTRIVIIPKVAKSGSQKLARICQKHQVIQIFALK